MSHSTKFRRPTLSLLENREVPADISVTFNAASHTLTVLGDAAINQLTIKANPAVAGGFVLTSSSDTIGGAASPFASAGDVRNMLVRMKGGDDLLNFDNTDGPIALRSLEVHGGGGANSIHMTGLDIRKNLMIFSGVGSTTTGLHDVLLTDITVGGTTSIQTGDADSFISIRHSTAGFNTIGGNLKVQNGRGSDFFELIDTNVGGNVNIKHGRGNAGGTAGTTWIYNNTNPGRRAIIGGNLSVSYLSGNARDNDGVWDTIVQGNATFRHGPGDFDTEFDGFTTDLATAIRGDLTIMGTGRNSVTVGSTYKKTGLDVGGKFAVDFGPKADTLTLNSLQVHGNTRLRLGAGGDTVTIDDSRFQGKFNLLMGLGNDSFNVEQATGTTASTFFERGATVRLGAGDDSATIAGTVDAGQRYVSWAAFTIYHGLGTDTNSIVTDTSSNPSFPFGGDIVWTV